MSSPVKCDHCKKVGRRRMMTCAPEGWFYLEATDDEEGPNSTIVVWACSTECAMAQWKKGPGRF